MEGQIAILGGKGHDERTIGVQASCAPLDAWCRLQHADRLERHVPRPGEGRWLAWT